MAEEEAVVINCLKNPQALAHQPAARSHPQKCHRQDLPAKSLQSQAAQAQALAVVAEVAAVGVAGAVAVVVVAEEWDHPPLPQFPQAAAMGKATQNVEG